MKAVACLALVLILGASRAEAGCTLAQITAFAHLALLGQMTLFDLVDAVEVYKQRCAATPTPTRTRAPTATRTLSRANTPTTSNAVAAMLGTWEFAEYSGSGSYFLDYFRFDSIGQFAGYRAAIGVNLADNTIAVAALLRDSLPASSLRYKMTVFNESTTYCQLFAFDFLSQDAVAGTDSVAHPIPGGGCGSTLGTLTFTGNHVQ